MPSVNIDIYARLHNAEKQVRDLSDRIDDLGREASTSDGKLKGLWVQVAGGILSVQTLNALFRGAGGLIKSFHGAATETENYETRLKALLGSQDAATRAMGFFQEVASQVPFTLQDIIEAGTTVTAFGADLEKWTPILADLAAVMGMDVTEAAEALGRAYAGGAGAADIFRERGILQIIKDSVKLKDGITDITKLTLPEFRDAMFEAFTDPEGKIAGAADDLATTWDGMISMFADHWYQFRQKVMDAGVFAFLKEGLGEVLEEINRLKKEGKIDEWAMQVAAVIIQAFKAAVQAVEIFVSGIEFMQGVLNSALQSMTDKFIQWQANLIAGTEILAKVFPPLQASLKGMYENLFELVKQSAAYRDEADKHYEKSADLVEAFDKIESHLQTAIDRIKEGKTATEGAGDAFDDLTTSLGGTSGAIQTMTDFLKTQGITTIEEKRKKVEELEGQLDLLHQAYKDGILDYADYIKKVNALKTEIDNLSTTITETAIPAARDLSGAVDQATTEMETNIGNFTVYTKGQAEEISKFYVQSIEGIADAWGDWFESILTKGSDFSDAMDTLFDSLVSNIRRALGDLLRDFIKENIFDAIIGKAKEAASATTDLVSGAAGAGGTGGAGGLLGAGGGAAGGLWTAGGAFLGTALAGLLTGGGVSKRTGQDQLHEARLTNILLYQTQQHELHWILDAVSPLAAIADYTGNRIPIKLDAIIKVLRKIRSNDGDAVTAQGGLHGTLEKDTHIFAHRGEEVHIFRPSVNIAPQPIYNYIYLDGKKIREDLTWASKWRGWKLHPRVTNKRF